MPILHHVEDPAQLKRLEDNSPHLKGETGPLWLEFIKKDVFGWKKLLLETPQRNGQCYTEDEIKNRLTHKQYARLMEKAEKVKERDLDLLRKSAVKSAKEQEAKQVQKLQPAPFAINSRRIRSRTAAPAGPQGSKVMAKIRKQAVDRRAIMGPKFIKALPKSILIKPSSVSKPVVTPRIQTALPISAVSRMPSRIQHQGHNSSTPKKDSRKRSELELSSDAKPSSSPAAMTPRPAKKIKTTESSILLPNKRPR
jgi:hypothetical protein